MIINSQSKIYIQNTNFKTIPIIKIEETMCDNFFLTKYIIYGI